jgi:hypothetical protein
VHTAAPAVDSAAAIAAAIESATSGTSRAAAADIDSTADGSSDASSDCDAAADDDLAGFSDVEVPPLVDSIKHVGTFGNVRIGVAGYVSDSDAGANSDADDDADDHAVPSYFAVSGKDILEVSNHYAFTQHCLYCYCYAVVANMYSTVDKAVCCAASTSCRTCFLLVSVDAIAD